MRIAVFGGSGVVGRHVVEEAHWRAHDATSYSRSTGVDLSTGAGLDAALEGAGCAVDVTNVLTLRRTPALRFFESSAKHLQAACARAGVPHIVVLSIVGIDHFRRLGYYDAKLTQERHHLDGVVPATVLRATQFHEFCGQVASRTRVGPVAFVPSMRVQTVAARAVAACLVDAAEGEARRVRLPDVGGPGPSVLLSDRTRVVLRAAGSSVRVVAVRPSGPARAAATGALLPAPDGRLVGPTFDEWLSGPDGPGA